MAPVPKGKFDLPTEFCAIKKTFLSRGAAVCFGDERGTVRRTKIISTLGPATDSAEMIGRLIDAGVNIFRLNMSHAPHDWVRRVFADIRAESAAARATPAS
jgi:hypothetical protein